MPDHDRHACAHETAPTAHAHHAHGGANVPLNKLTTSATLHCLTGCAIGDFIGLAIGINLGLNPWATMGLAVAFGFASGFAFSLVPLLRSGLSFSQAWRAIWLGETISIAIMELAMNVADYHVGGVQVASMMHGRFWLGYGAALIAGFAAAWPVNRWMLARAIKKPCH